MNTIMTTEQQLYLIIQYKIPKSVITVDGGNSWVFQQNKDAKHIKTGFGMK